MKRAVIAVTDLRDELTKPAIEALILKWQSVNGDAPYKIAPWLPNYDVNHRREIFTTIIESA